jgi:hypothetical protein
MLVEVVVRTMSELEEVHKKIEEFDGVIKVCPAILIKNIK